MKKLAAVMAGILLFFCSVFGFKLYMNHSIASHKEALRNHRTYERYWSSETNKLILEENTLPIFGSSELVPLTDMEDHIGSFLNGDEMNIVTIGGGSFQSLSHAITLGAISEGISSKKVALFLSPQWFQENGCDSTAFAARMSEDELLSFLLNHQISTETKNYVLGRAIHMLADSPTQLERVKRYQKAVNNKWSLDYLYTRIMGAFWKYRAEYEVFSQLDSVSSVNIPRYDLSSLSFEDILREAERQGISSCTNNDFGIYDEYWDTYLKERFEQGEITEKHQVFNQSPEYEDLKCFLDVARQVGVEVILVSIPVNAAWYRYEGQLCDEYYSNIRNIALLYDHVAFCDMSQYENEPYFLKDIMHLGWKGWARINEALYKEFV